MADPQSRRYSSGEVSDIVRLALENKSGGDDISYGDLLDIAHQSGVSPDQIRSAIEYRETEGQLDLDGIDYQTVEELGDPVSRLIAVCEINEADVLVVGRRGAGLAERVILGSVADRLCHLASCPVLVVP